MVPTEIDLNYGLSRPLALPPTPVAKIPETWTSPTLSMVPTEIDLDYGLPRPLALPPIPVAQVSGTRTSPTLSTVPTEIDLDYASVSISHMSDELHSDSTELSPGALIDEDLTPTSSALLFNADPSFTASAGESHTASATASDQFPFTFSVPRQAPQGSPRTPPQGNIMEVSFSTEDLLESDSTSDIGSSTTAARKFTTHDNIFRLKLT